MVRNSKTYQSFLLFFGFILPILGVSHLRAQDIVINEILASNQAGIEDEDGDTSDWIELYNAGSESMDLSGYTLTDDEDEPDQWAFPSIVLESHSYLLIWASGKDRQNPSELHTNFKLNTSGEYVGFFDTTGTLVDGFFFGSHRADISYGRFPDGSDTFVSFQNPTPGSANQEGTALSFSLQEGIYPQDISVELQSGSGAAFIYYTLDGSEPEPSDFLYSSPVIIDTSTVLRARVFLGGIPVTEIKTRTYIVKDDPQLPVLSIASEPDHIWGTHTGIYTNYDSSGREWERPIHVTLLENNNTEFSLPAGLRIHGQSSRVLPKKNFRLYFRSEYGENELNYPLFDERPFTRYKRLVLYAPSNDQVTGDIELFTLIADALLQDLWFSQGGNVSLFRPVSVYLNGAYWGIYWIREYIDRHYVESNYGFTNIDLNRIVKGWTYPEVREGDSDYWMETIQFLDNHDMYSDAHIDSVETKYFYIDNFTDYHLFCIYSATLDWPHNNVDIFRNREGNDPRWRYVMWDHNYAWRKASPYHLSLFWATRGNVRTDIDPMDYPGLLKGTFVLRKMLINESYRYFFVNRFADLINTVLSAENIEGYIDDLEAAIRPEMERELQRWDLGVGVDIYRWDYVLQRVRFFVQERPRFMREQIRDKFFLGNMGEITILPSVGNGTVTISTITPENLPWTGTYLYKSPIPFKATPDSGWIFTHWTNPSLPSEAEFSLQLTEDLEIQAVFKEILLIENLQITSITDTSAVIGWRTNQATMSQIEFGTDSNYGQSLDVRTKPYLEHGVELRPLQPETEYHFRVLNWNTLGDTVISGDHVFQTADYLQMNEINVDSVTHSEAFIEWTTNRPSIGQIVYGTDSNLGMIQADSVYGTVHEAHLINLNGGITYYFQIEASDSLAHRVMSDTLSFTTPTATLVDHPEESPLASREFQLKQNYPNPFNSGTWIELKCPEPGFLEAVILNVYGQEIIRLYSQECASGDKRLYWDGVDLRGQAVSSGVYIFRARFEGNSGVEKTSFTKLLLNR